MPPLIAERWGWDQLLDKRHATHTFSICNKCAKKRRLNPRCLDYAMLDRALKKSGQHEFIVHNQDGKRMTHREYLVEKKRAERRQRKVLGGKKAQRSRYAQQYTSLLHLLKTEFACVKYQRKRSEQELEQQTQANDHNNTNANTHDRATLIYSYVNAYTEHLQALRSAIHDAQKDHRKAKAMPTDYINPDSLPTRTARQLHQTLTNKEQGRVSSKYLY